MLKPLTSPPKSIKKYVDSDKYHSTVKAGYTPGIKKHPKHAVGTWRRDSYSSPYGHEIEELRHVHIHDLETPETPGGKLSGPKRGHDAEYAERSRKGHEAPPIHVVQTDKGKLRVIDGHRRVLAHKLLGRKKIKAWVSYSVDHPEGTKDSNGETMKVGLTHELYHGKRVTEDAAKEVATGRKLAALRTKASTDPKAHALWKEYSDTSARVGKKHSEFELTMGGFKKRIREMLESGMSAQDIASALLENSSYFTPSDHFANEAGDKWSVTKVASWAKNNLKPKNTPISSVQHDMKYWQGDKARMMKSDTKYPIMVVHHKAGGTSVVDGLNRMKKARDVENKTHIPAYHIREQDIDHLRIPANH